MCLTVRPVRPTGRRTNRQDNSSSQIIPSRYMSNIRSMRCVISWLRETPDLSLNEKELLGFLLDEPQTLQYFVISPRFVNAEHESLACLLPTALPILKDAYLAYAGVLKSLLRSDATETNDEANLRHITSAMITLRSLSVSRPEDVEPCLTLGFALATTVYATIGVGISDICHYCLSLTASFIDGAAADPEMAPRISFLVLLETMECIVYRRKPTLRIQSPNPSNVDRHLGLCVPLLSYYYDLCIISHCLVDNSDTTHIRILRQQLEDIRMHVDKWQPSHPEGFMHDFSTVEVIQLLAQARVYRLAALLMIHRLLHTFGQGDSQADVWSHEVMMELETVQHMTNQPSRFVTIPYIIAAVETRDPVERNKVLRNVDKYVDQFTPVVQQATKAFLSRIWHERDLYPNCSWFHSIHKPCVVLDSFYHSLAVYS